MRVDALEVVPDRQREFIMRDAFQAFDGRYASGGDGSRTGACKAQFKEFASAGIRFVATCTTFLFAFRSIDIALILIIILLFCAHNITPLIQLS